jgi:pimeloyl-ACP methyl ester carboxylesterase
VLWFWIGLAILCSMPTTAVLWLVWLHFYLRRNYLHFMVRIFQEKPLFVVPRGQPVPGAEEVHFRTTNGLTLRGCYLKAPGPRRGVILFGLEFGSNRWACVPYCEHLVRRGYDVFTFEPRGQGESDGQPGYEPLQWVTAYEVEDFRAALAYLKGRADTDPRGIGLFGISKGAGAGLQAAADDPCVRCCVSDGVFATYTTLVPYMRQWFQIYNNLYVRQALVPAWFYGHIGLIGLRQIERQRGCRFVHLEPALRRLGGRPLLMIHGATDTYIKPEMARRLFRLVTPPKDLWLVPEAKHNQAFQLAGEEYRQRVLEFFDRYLADPSADGCVHGPEEVRARDVGHRPGPVPPTPCGHDAHASLQSPA